jgi:hypothetical protein
MFIIKNILLFAILSFSFLIHASDNTESSYALLTTILGNENELKTTLNHITKIYGRRKSSAKDEPAYNELAKIFWNLSQELIAYSNAYHESANKLTQLDEQIKLIDSRIEFLAKKKPSKPKNRKKKNNVKTPREKKNKLIEKHDKLIAQKNELLNPQTALFNPRAYKCLKQISHFINHYLLKRRDFGIEFYAMQMGRGTIAQIQGQSFCSPEHWEGMSDSETILKCNIATVDALAPFDNYTKLSLDFLYALGKENPHIATLLKEILVIDLSSRLDDGPALAYSYQPNPSLEEYVSFIKIEDNSYILGENLNQSKEFFWLSLGKVQGLDENNSKLYINFKPARNGILFIFLNNKVLYHLYRAAKPVPNFDWSILTFDETSVWGPLEHDRLNVSYNVQYEALMKYIEFDEIRKIESIFLEIEEQELFNHQVFKNALDWMLSVKANQQIASVEDLPFYPEKLRRLKLREREDLSEQELVRHTKSLDKKFKKEEKTLKSRDYEQELNHMLARNKSVGDRFVAKCASVWMKMNREKTKKVHTTGSHRQFEGVKGEKTKTLVPPHGPKAKRGLPVKELQRWLLGRPELLQDDRQ